MFVGAGIQFTLNGTNTAVNDEVVSLPGGVTDDIQGSTAVWSFPDLHGDDVVTTNGSGTRTGSIAIYDPFGNPINLTTGLIGTLTANSQDLGNTSTPGATFGWEGSHLKQDQHTGDIATIEMGARQYVPLLGRFLSVDPAPGGNLTDYNYPDDPINGNDRSGDMREAPDGVGPISPPTSTGKGSKRATPSSVGQVIQLLSGVIAVGTVLTVADEQTAFDFASVLVPETTVLGIFGYKYSLALAVEYVLDYTVTGLRVTAGLQASLSSTAEALAGFGEGVASVAEGFAAGVTAVALGIIDIPFVLMPAPTCETLMDCDPQVS